MTTLTIFLASIAPCSNLVKQRLGLACEHRTRLTIAARFSFIFIGFLATDSVVRGQNVGYANNQELCDYTTEYQLVFEEDFHGQAIDYSKWVTWFPFSSDGSDQCLACRASNTTISLDENVLVAEGLLNIQTHKQSTTWLGVTRTASSGVIWSRQRFNEGKFEIRCMIPGEVGIWPAFWLFGGSQNNEIDVFEFCGEEPNRMRTNIHRVEDYVQLSGNLPFNSHYSIPLPYNDHRQDPESHMVSNTGFHTYAVEWLDDWIIWYFDGTEQRRICRWQELWDVDDCTLNGPYSEGLFIPADVKLNVLVSVGQGDGSFCSLFNRPPGYTVDWLVDYVRVWQNVGAFEPGLSNICSQPTRVESSTNHFCAVGDEITFHLVGPHGDPIQWTLTGNGTTSLEITDADNGSCTVRCISFPGNGYQPIINAVDPQNPCSSSAIFSKNLYLGKPLFGESGSGNQNIIADCPDSGEQQFWSIQAQVRGAEPVQPAPMTSFTTYYPPLEPYNIYNPDSPGQPSITWHDLGVARYFKVFVDNEEQTRTFLPDAVGEYAPGVAITGPNCSEPPLSCPEHWEVWGMSYRNPNQIFSAVRDGDFCHDVRLEAENGCGMTSYEFTVKDYCKIGDCDFIDPEVEIRTVFDTWVGISPVPASGTFDITFDQRIDMDWITKIWVHDAMYTPKYTKLNPRENRYTVDCANWPSGVYYVTVVIKDQDVLLKVQIK